MAKGTSNILLPYENKWVAITFDGKKVVASASTVKELDRKLKKVKNEKVMLTKVLPFDVAYSP